MMACLTAPHPDPHFRVQATIFAPAICCRRFRYSLPLLGGPRHGGGALAVLRGDVLNFASDNAADHDGVAEHITAGKPILEEPERTRQPLPRTNRRTHAGVGVRGKHKARPAKYGFKLIKQQIFRNRESKRRRLTFCTPAICSLRPSNFGGGNHIFGTS
jgi:hypothetical protein